MDIFCYYRYVLCSATMSRSAKYTRKCLFSLDAFGAICSAPACKIVGEEITGEVCA